MKKTKEGMVDEDLFCFLEVVTLKENYVFSTNLCD
jgi:hypothetical protein